MPLIRFATVIALLAIPALASALLYSVAGNEPQSPENYKQWPGLADVVNQPSRQSLVWCNGGESCSYTGETDALNAMLKLYAKVECPTHTVIFRPGPLSEKYDWELHFAQGITKFMIEKHEMQSVRDVDPTLVVYVSDKLDLNSVVIPDGFKIKQLSDLRSRYLNAQKEGNDRTQQEAAGYLKSLDEDPVRESLGQAGYDAQVRRISEFIKQLPKPQPPADSQ